MFFKQKCREPEKRKREARNYDIVEGKLIVVYERTVDRVVCKCCEYDGIYLRWGKCKDQTKEIIPKYCCNCGYRFG